jgi:hypothetical protein
MGFQVPPTRPAALCTHHQYLSAKSILKQFDIPKTKPGVILDEAAQALANLAKELDSEEHTEQESWETEDGNDDNLKDDDQPLDHLGGPP